MYQLTVISPNSAFENCTVVIITL